MKKILIFLFICIGSIPLFAQHYGAYSDFRDRFYIFDRGEHKMVEDLKIQSYKIGGSHILYVNSSGHLKLYTDGVLSTLERAGASEYYATDYIAAYSIFEKLKVIEDGEPVTLSHRCPVYIVEDSLIAFYDKNLESLRIYYNGNMEDIESGMVGIPIHSLKSGNNIVAYISTRTQDFKIFYKGENHTILEYVDKIAFEAGKDIVAYANVLDNTFNAFYKGEIYKLSDFLPRSFKVGDGFVAFVDNQGAFKVFSRYGVQEVSSFEPDQYFANDKLLVFIEEDYFKVFSDGKVFDLEAYVPRNYGLDWNSLVYIDNTNRVWLFSNGEKKYLINEFIQDVELYRDLVQLSLKMNRTKIYYQGEVYEGVSY